MKNRPEDDYLLVETCSLHITLCNKNSCADVQISITIRIQAFHDVFIQITIKILWWFQVSVFSAQHNSSFARSSTYNKKKFFRKYRNTTSYWIVVKSMIFYLKHLSIPGSEYSRKWKVNKLGFSAKSGVGKAAPWKYFKINK